jgi:hypothetical protein
VLILIDAGQADSGENMSLEFKKLMQQIAKMEAVLSQIEIDFTGRFHLAKERFERASDLDAVWQRIEWVRHTDVSGYRGAAPLDVPGMTAEAVNFRRAAPPVPDQATIIAVDGSQVYPEEQSPVHYFLLNTGVFVYHHGVSRTPEQLSTPKLFYHPNHVHDKYGRLIRNRDIDDQRTLLEMQTLGQQAWERQGEARPLVALYDNRLMFLPGGGNEAENREMFQQFLGGLVHLHDSGALLAGYVDNPFRSKRFIQLLYLLSLNSIDEVHEKQRELRNAGDLDGIRDQQFFDYILEPGERSAIMVQNSPQNLKFRERGENYEIAFFYLKVATPSQSRVVRVDIPVWVARDPQAVDQLHALLLSQCQLMGRNPYPYALTRADELAVVSNKDKNKLQDMINVGLRNRGVNHFGPVSGKVRGKELARSEKRSFDLKTE